MQTNPEGRMAGGSHNKTVTLEDIFKDFQGRRAALIKALTSDVDKLDQQCDPEKDSMCLFGFPDGQWAVNLPGEMVPPKLPEPSLGINFPRDGIKRKSWLTWIAVYSDSWLVSVAFYCCTKLGFDRVDDRKRLFDMINDLPTLTEVVRGAAQKQSEESSNSSSKKPESNSKDSTALDEITLKVSQLKYEEDDEYVLVEKEDEREETLCRVCDGKYSPDEYWICCDVCEESYHGKCVKMAPSEAEHVKQYECPICNNKRACCHGLNYTDETQ